MSGSRSPARWLAPALTVAVLAIFSLFLWRNRGHIEESYSLAPAPFLGVAVLFLATLAVRAVANRLHFAGLGVPASTADWFRLVTVTSFTNYLPFSAGLVAKAVVLKRLHQMPFARFAVGQTSLLLLILGTNGLVGLVVLAWAFPDRLLGIVGLGLACMVAAGGLLALPPRVRALVSPRWFPFAENVGAEARRHWPWVALCQLVMLLLASVSLQLCFAMGASAVGLLPCLLFTSAAVLTRVVTVVPGALGLREFAIGGLAALTGFDLRDAVIASSLARAVEIVVVFALGGVFTWTLSHEVVRSYDTDPSAPPPPSV